MQGLPARLVRGVGSSPPLSVAAACDLIPAVHFYSSSVAVLALGARTSNLVTSVDFIDVPVGAAESTERSAGSCTRPLGGSM